MNDLNARPDWLPPDHMPPEGFLADYLVFWAVLLVLCVGTGTYLYRVWFRAGRRTPWTRAVGMGLVALSTLWGAVVAGETYLRYVYDASDSYGLMVTNWAWMVRHGSRQNGLGFRDVEYSRDRPPGVRLTAFVGDSFAWGYGVPDPADRMPDRVRAELDRREPGRDLVWNVSRIGLDTRQEMDLVRDFHDNARLDRVVLVYCLNDVEDLLPAKTQFHRTRVPRPRWIAPWRSFLLDFLWFRAARRSDPRIAGYFEWVETAYRDGEIWSRQAARFAELAEYCRRQRIRLDVVVYPLFGCWGPGYPFDEAHDRVREAWNAVGVRVVDLRETYRGLDAAELVANRFDAHPNAYANELAARTVLTELFPR